MHKLTLEEVRNIRRECLHIASTLNISQYEILRKASEFFDWIVAFEVEDAINSVDSEQN